MMLNHEDTNNEEESARELRTMKYIWAPPCWELFTATQQNTYHLPKTVELSLNRLLLNAFSR